MVSMTKNPRSGSARGLSLDHDLGDDQINGGGDAVVCWIETAVATRGFDPPRIQIHSRNVVRRHRMEQAIAAINKLVSQ